MQRSKSVLVSLFTILVPVIPIAAAAQDDATEEVVVVGTRGEGRSPLDSAVPVDVISADEIMSTHSFGGELGELLQALAPSFNVPRQSNSGAGDHVRAAQLRGMSPDHTLVLVNGKRQHTASVVALESAIGLGTNPFAFNTIPLHAIRRIEILRDGAGAQYGSDAIAGVINIVLKDGAEGGSVAASYGAHRTDFQPASLDITDGHTVSVSGDYGFDVGDGGFLRVGAEYRSRDATNRAGIGDLPFFENQTPEILAIDSSPATAVLTTSTSTTTRSSRPARANSILSRDGPIASRTAPAFSATRTRSTATSPCTRTASGRSLPATIPTCPLRPDCAATASTRTGT